MSSNYPPGVTGNEDYFTGVWYCARCDEKQDPQDDGHLHPITEELYCDGCHETLLERGEWPIDEPEVEEEPAAPPAPAPAAFPWWIILGLSAVFYFVARWIHPRDVEAAVQLWIAATGMAIAGELADRIIDGVRQERRASCGRR